MNPALALCEVLPRETTRNEVVVTRQEQVKARLELVVTSTIYLEGR